MFTPPLDGQQGPLGLVLFIPLVVLTPGIVILSPLLLTKNILYKQMELHNIGGFIYKASQRVKQKTTTKCSTCVFVSHRSIA